MCRIQYNYQLVLIVLATLAFVSCSKDEGDPPPTEITVTTADFSITMDENPTKGQIIGSVEGSTNQGQVAFILTEQNPSGAFSIDKSSGELKVADETLFDFETNPVITGTVKVVNGAVIKNATVTITLNDLEELNVFEGNIRLKSQQEVNDFGRQQYTHITGNLIIGEFQNYSSDIEDLKPLRNLTTIDGNLHIINNGELRSTLGLENLSSIGGGLAFVVNSVLEKVEGMQNITTIPGYLEFHDNLELSDLDGINQITSVGEKVSFFDMPKLKNLDWMSNISSIGDFLSVGYTGITNVDGLSKLRSLGTQLSFQELPYLTNLDGLANLTATIERLDIANNKSLLSIKGIRNIKPTNLVYIASNKELKSLDGLQGIETVTYLLIGINDAIENLEGLNNLKSVNGKFTIASNRSLKNLNGLDALNNVDSDLDVVDNYFLKDFCDIRDFLTNGTLGSFNAVYNAFNPTKQDIIDGNCKI